MFGSSPVFPDFQMITGKSSSINSARKILSNSIDRLPKIQNRTASDIDPNNRDNRSFKGRKFCHSPRTDVDDECDPPPIAKLRVSNNLLEREPSNPPNSTKATSTASSDTNSPDVKSISSNTPLDEDDNESNESLNEQEQNNVKQNYNLTSNEYFTQRSTLELPHQGNQPQQAIYEEQQQHFENQYSQSQYPAVYIPNEENGNSRQRKERMSKRQKELYVEFLEQNPVVNKHRRNDPLLDIFWLRMANILNSCPNGAAKSVAEWKQAFDNWRYRVFLYARHNSQLNGEDAMNSKAFKPLTRTDKRAYNLWIRNPDTAPANTEKLPNDLICSED